MKKITRKDAKAQGLNRYYTGKECKHGHVAERRTQNGGCCECIRLYVPSPLTAEQKKQIAAYKKVYDKKYLADPVNTATKKRADMLWRANNRQRMLSCMRKYYKTHKEETLSYQRIYREDNADSIREYEACRSKTPERKVNKAIYEAKRRALKAQGYIELSSQEKEEERQFYEDRDELNYSCPFNEGFFHIDHIKPLSKGGTHHPDNLQLLLDKENMKKGSKYENDKD